jgi:hypothetical protein
LVLAIYNCSRKRTIARGSRNGSRGKRSNYLAMLVLMLAIDCGRGGRAEEGCLEEAFC